MRTITAVTAIIVSIFSLAMASENSLNLLEGKYPWEGANPESPSFFQNLEVEKSVNKLVPVEYRKLLLDAYKVGTPNRILKDYLVVSSCKQHNCPSENYIAIANIHSNEIYFILYDAKSGIDDHNSTQCFSSEPFLKNLPSSLKEEILLMHIPKMTKDDLLYPKNIWIDKVICHQ